MSTFEKQSDSALEILADLENAVAKSVGSYGELRKRAEDLYQNRVEQIAKERGVDMAKAHGLATSDDVAQRAYMVSQELADRQDSAFEGGAMAAAYAS